MGNVDIFSPFGSHSKFLAQFFKRYHPGLIMDIDAMQNPRKLSIFSRVLKPNKL